MSIEEALRDRLSDFEGLENKVFPLHAPKGISAPYIIYVSKAPQNIKSIDNTSMMFELQIEINILHNKYSSLKQLVREIVDDLENINETKSLGGYQIQELVLEGVAELYEHQVDMYRSALNITLYFEEV